MEHTVGYRYRCTVFVFTACQHKSIRISILCCSMIDEEDNYMQAELQLLYVNGSSMYTICIRNYVHWVGKLHDAIVVWWYCTVDGVSLRCGNGTMAHTIGYRYRCIVFACFLCACFFFAWVVFAACFLIQCPPIKFTVFYSVYTLKIGWF